MARRAQSSIKRKLSPELVAEIHIRLDAGDTLDAILERVRAGGGDVSRSALGRYAQNFAKVRERLIELREVATAFRRELGDDAESDAGRVLIEMVRTLAFRASAGAMESDAPASAEEVADLARAVANLARAGKIGVDTVVTIKERLRLGLDKVEKEAKASNLTAAEVLERARELVRGAL